MTDTTDSGGSTGEGGSQGGNTGNDDPEACSDADADEVCDEDDKCAEGDDSLDDDADGIPDACDVCAEGDDALDEDADGVADACDVCSAGDDALDEDRDGVPDACDRCEGEDDRIDSDTDGAPDACDICEDEDDFLDSDGDGIPNGCDSCDGDNELDSDADGVPNACDVCEGGDDSLDDDLDGVPDHCDTCDGDNRLDEDMDSVPDACDACAGGDDLLDSDDDSIADHCDICTKGDDALDDDLDGVPNACDACEGENDGNDVDGDGIPDACDGCGIGLTLSQAPYAYWRGADGVDASGNGRDLTPSGALLAATGVTEDQDGGFTFDHTGELSYLGGSDFELPSGALSVSMWVRLHPGQATSQYFLSYAVPSSDNELILGYVNNNLQLFWNQVRVADVSLGTSPRDGKYHHVAVTYDETTVRLYRDGVEVYNGAQSALTSGGSLIFGQEQDSVGSGFNGNQDVHGDLDEIALFSEVLSPEGVVDLMQSSRCTLASCSEQLLANPSAPSGTYWIDPDGSENGIDAMLGYCNMEYDGGGWQLFYSTLGGGHTVSTSAQTVLPGTQSYLPQAELSALAGAASQVHIRTSNQAAVASVTSTPNSSPIVHLRAGELLNTSFDLVQWTGPLATTSTLDPNGCATNGASYPDLYDAACNTEGLHIGADNSEWDSGDTPANLEVYVR